MSALTDYSQAKKRMASTTEQLEHISALLKRAADVVTWWRLSDFSGTTITPPADSHVGPIDKAPFDIRTTPTSQEAIEALDSYWHCKAHVDTAYHSLSQDEKDVIGSYHAD